MSETRRITAVMVLALAMSPVIAQETPPEQPLTLERIMTDPDWIGPPVEAGWWSMDGGHVYYRVKREGSPVRDIHRVDTGGEGDTVLAPEQLANIAGEAPVYDAGRERALYIHHGDVYLHDLDSGDRQQLTRSEAAERNPGFAADGKSVIYQRGDDWLLHDPAAGLAGPAARVLAEDPPDQEPEADFLRDMQMRLFDTLREAKQEEQAKRERQRELRRADAQRVPEPFYLGAERSLAASSLSPSGHWLIAVTEPAGAEQGQAGKMPRYVTESGYVAVEEVRTRVGRKAPAAQKLVLLDLDKHKQHELDASELPGLFEDPLAKLKKEQDIELDEDQPRPFTIMGIEWNRAGDRAAVMVHASDNKDRWIATVNFEDSKLKPLHRIHDRAWINWNFNEFGWMPDGETLWYVSEESGYAHFYTVDADRGDAEQHTEGGWEVYSPRVGPEGRYVYFVANREQPIEYELYRLDLDRDRVQRLTDLDGVESFALSPDAGRALLRWSGSYTPPQLAVVDLEPGATARKLTDTRTDEYQDFDWQQPAFVKVPSAHVERPIWSKLYRPADIADGRQPPVVMFVHGAGYTQNTHQRFPYYFREQMFHNLLVQRGYIVLDMDYRASEGYGRDWRTAIYRRMGHPELEDLIDGVEWLQREFNADAERVGVYGGSYGGFMTFMAMFRAPETFTAGAALRPVTDWAHYNHGYTSNILNTPEVDPEAYQRSSPIEFAEGLQGGLLFAHGMLDDNVLYQDSVRLAQRLIELEKPDWEFASYPQEPHSFEHESAWLDEYRRILKLFEETIGAERG